MTRLVLLPVWKSFERGLWAHRLVWTLRRRGVRLAMVGVWSRKGLSIWLDRNMTLALLLTIKVFPFKKSADLVMSCHVVSCPGFQSSILSVYHLKPYSYWHFKIIFYLWKWCIAARFFHLSFSPVKSWDFSWWAWNRGAKDHHSAGQSLRASADGAR